MPYISPHQKLIIASHNDGKVQEIAELLNIFDDEIISAKMLAIPEPEETENSFIGNAKLKAEFCANHSNLPALADDSGLCIDALDGAPGIYSARFAKQHGGFEGAADYLALKLNHSELQNHGNHNLRAHFTCVLALAFPKKTNTQTQIFEGYVHGNLCFPARGTHGFGYDPIFIADGYDISFGEMLPQQKHAISHRADAFKQLIQSLA